jgi:hypothetical protein
MGRPFRGYPSYGALPHPQRRRQFAANNWRDTSPHVSSAIKRLHPRYRTPAMWQTRASRNTGNRAHATTVKLKRAKFMPEVESADYTLEYRARSCQQRTSRPKAKSLRQFVYRLNSPVAKRDRLFSLAGRWRCYGRTEPQSGPSRSY